MVASVPDWLIASVGYQRDIDRMTGEIQGITSNSGRRTMTGAILYRVEIQSFDDYVLDYFDQLEAMRVVNQAGYRRSLEASCPDTC